ncbi:MAG: metal-dependent hydrolase [Elusimicrobiota bacterium]|jgi:hypothetical protein
MNPVTHFLAGWAVGLPVDLSRRDRGVVVLASISPDIDALPIVIDLVQGRQRDSLELWSRFHHSAHNLAFAVAVSVACMAVAERRYATAATAFVALQLHYACDIVGSRGPDGYQWPIPYLAPFSDAWQLTVPWQWALNAWPNVLFTIILMGIMFHSAWARGFSPVGLFSLRADQALIDTLRVRFGTPR